MSIGYPRAKQENTAQNLTKVYRCTKKKKKKNSSEKENETSFIFKLRNKQNKADK